MVKKILLPILILPLLFAGFYLFRLHQTPIKSSVLSAQKKSDYTIVFVGDSMTEFLGNFDELRADLAKYFPGKIFLLLNYGFGSTNLLSLPDRIENDSTHSGRIFQPINQIPYDLILIESFANNPLSEYPINQGFQIQEATLDKAVSLLSKKHPQSTLVFLSTIAPNRDYFGLGAVNLDPSQRQQWVDERVSYLRNHSNYAKNHQIPLIDIYSSSLDSKGTGNLNYLDPHDYIHPSPTGIRFISSQIADFIYQHRLLP